MAIRSSNIAWGITLLAAGGIYWMLRRKQNSTPTLLEHPEYNMKENKRLPRGYRNNNPLNIIYDANGDGKADNNWKGQTGVEPGGRFAQFVDLAHGYRAAFVLLRGPGYIGKGFNTIEKIITKFAPPEENDTAGYIESVSRMTGIPKDHVISRNDKDTLTSIVYAMSIIENGTKEAKPYNGDLKELYNLPNMEIINAGWELM